MPSGRLMYCSTSGLDAGHHVSWLHVERTGAATCPNPRHSTARHSSCRIAQPAGSTSLHCTRHSTRQSLNPLTQLPPNSITCCVSPIALGGVPVPLLTQHSGTILLLSASQRPGTLAGCAHSLPRRSLRGSSSRAVAAPKPICRGGVEFRRGSAPPGVTLPDESAGSPIASAGSPRDRRGSRSSCAWWARFSRSAGSPARAAVW